MDPMVGDSAADESLVASLQVGVTTFSGERLELPRLATSASMQELHAAVKERFGIPAAAQQFVFNGAVLHGDPAHSLGKLFGLPKGGGGKIELSCVRIPLPAEKQRAVNEILLLSAARGHCDSMATALADGALVNIGCPGEEDRARQSQPSGPTPLAFALALGDKAAAKLLRDAGAAELASEPRSGTLGGALGRGDIADAVRLLGQGADPNARLRRGEGVRDTDYGAPLHACCALHDKVGATALAELLCRMRADPAARDCEGDSALAHARYFGAGDVFDVLTAHGAKVEGPFYNRNPILRLLGTAANAR